jgi:hypothetical protein
MTGSCGHAKHVGSCPTCQRAQLARWRAQLLQARALETGITRPNSPRCIKEVGSSLYIKWNRVELAARKPRASQTTS